MATMNMETRDVPASTEAPSGFIQKLYDLVNSGEETIGVSRSLIKRISLSKNDICPHRRPLSTMSKLAAGIRWARNPSVTSMGHFFVWQVVRNAFWLMYFDRLVDHWMTFFVQFCDHRVAQPLFLRDPMDTTSIQMHISKVTSADAMNSSALGREKSHGLYHRKKPIACGAHTNPYRSSWRWLGESRKKKRKIAKRFERQGFVWEVGNALWG